MSFRVRFGCHSNEIKITFLELGKPSILMPCSWFLSVRTYPTYRSFRRSVGRQRSLWRLWCPLSAVGCSLPIPKRIPFQNSLDRLRSLRGSLKWSWNPHKYNKEVTKVGSDLWWTQIHFRAGFFKMLRLFHPSFETMSFHQMKSTSKRRDNVEQFVPHYPLISNEEHNKELWFFKGPLFGRQMKSETNEAF